jgi:glycolate oxidase iron-sulfur subunit
VTVKEYGHLLEIDPSYRGKAERVSELTVDLCEVIGPEDLPQRGKLGRIAFHPPCTLQHGQQLRGRIEALLTRVGYELVPVRDAHLCCGSAGTYSLLQPQIAGELRARKLAALQEGAPQAIATANIGCLVHLQEPTTTPVRHWIELVDAALA